jgi:hypothetical protein
MTACVVICSECVDDRYQQPRHWQHLCEDCATDQLGQHRRDTGHTDLELRVVTNLTDDTHRSRRAATRAYRAAKRLGL